MLFFFKFKGTWKSVINQLQNQQILIALSPPLSYSCVYNIFDKTKNSGANCEYTEFDYGEAEGIT